MVSASRGGSGGTQTALFRNGRIVSEAFPAFLQDYSHQRAKEFEAAEKYAPSEVPRIYDRISVTAIKLHGSTVQSESEK